MKLNERVRLLDIVLIIREKLWLIIIITVIFGVVGGIYGKYVSNAVGDTEIKYKCEASIILNSAQLTKSFSPLNTENQYDLSFVLINDENIQRLFKDAYPEMQASELQNSLYLKSETKYLYRLVLIGGDKGKTEVVFNGIVDYVLKQTGILFSQTKADIIGYNDEAVPVIVEPNDNNSTITASGLDGIKISLLDSDIPVEQDTIKSIIEKGIIGSCAGAFLAVLVIILAYFLDKHLWYPYEITQSSNVKVLETIPKGGANADSLLNVSQILSLAKPQSLLVVSCHNGEGKSLISQKLAENFCNMGKDVTYFNFGDEKLTNVKALNEKIEKEKIKGKFVIVEIPALEKSNSIPLFGQNVDTALLVIEAGRNTENEILTIKHFIEEQHMQLVGVVLNKAKSGKIWAREKYFGTYFNNSKK